MGPAPAKRSIPVDVLLLEVGPNESVQTLTLSEPSGTTDLSPNWYSRATFEGGHFAVPPWSPDWPEMSQIFNNYDDTKGWLHFTDAGKLQGQVDILLQATKNRITYVFSRDKIPLAVLFMVNTRNVHFSCSFEYSGQGNWTAAPIAPVGRGLNSSVPAQLLLDSSCPAAVYPCFVGLFSETLNKSFQLTALTDYSADLIPADDPTKPSRQSAPDRNGVLYRNELNVLEGEGDFVLQVNWLTVRCMFLIDGKIIASFEVARVPPPQPDGYALASVQGKGIWADGSPSEGSSQARGSSHSKGSKAVTVLAWIAGTIVTLTWMWYAIGYYPQLAVDSEK